MANDSDVSGDTKRTKPTNLGEAALGLLEVLQRHRVVMLEPLQQLVLRPGFAQPPLQIPHLVIEVTNAVQVGGQDARL